MTRYFAVFRLAYVTTFLILVCAVASGCEASRGNFSALPQASDVLGSAASRKPASVSRASATATPSPTPNPSSTPILVDTNPSTAGVFLGDVCPSARTPVPCLDFASVFFVKPAFSNIFGTWDTDLATLMKNNHTDLWSENNTIPEITWQPESTVTPVTLAGINAGTWDTYIQQQAIELREYGSPVFLRPFHEFNGNWFPWSLDANGADSQADDEFIRAWRHMVTIFRNNNATNVKFIWCFASSTDPSPKKAPWNAPIMAYPGDSYVDWVAFDAYNRGNDLDPTKWFSFDEVVADDYAQATTISSARPIFISETASNEYGDGGAMKAAWIGQLTSELVSPTATNSYPHVRAVSWFDSNPHGFDYNLLSTVPATAAWITGIRTMGPNGVQNFRGNGGVMFSSITSWNS